MVILNNTGSKGVRVLPDFYGKIILKEDTTNFEANIVSITSNERKSEPNSPFNLKNATFFDLDENDFVLGINGSYMTIIDNKNKFLFRKHINSNSIQWSKDISQLITNYTNNIYHYITSKEVLYYLEQKEDYIHLFRFNATLNDSLYEIDPQKIDGDIKCILVDEAENYCYIITSSYIYVYELKLNNNNYLSQIASREHGGYVYGKDQEQLYVVTRLYSETIDNQRNIYINLLKTKENKIDSERDIFIGTVDKNEIGEEDYYMGIFNDANCYYNGKPIYKNFTTGYQIQDEYGSSTGVIKNKNIICNGNALSFNFTTYIYASAFENITQIKAIEFTNAISFLNGDEILLITNQGDWNFLRNDGMNYSYHIDNQDGLLKENIVYYDDNKIIFQVGQKLYIWPRIITTHWNEYEYVITTDNEALPYLP